MKGPEIHPAVDADLKKARELAEAQQREAEKALRRRRLRELVEEEAKLKKADTSITLKLILKLILTVAIVTGLELALSFNLMAWILVVPLEIVALLWLGVYFGAWLQFRFGKGRLLK